MAETLYQRKPELVAADMDGERVMLDIESGRYFALKGVGGFIWDAIEDPKSEAAIVEAIMEKFDTNSAESVPSDVAGFLISLVSSGLVLCHDG